MFQINIEEKIRIRILCLKRFLENRAVYETMSKKYGGAKEAAHGNMAAHCLLN